MAAVVGWHPALAAFLYFLWVHLKQAIPMSRGGGAAAVAALAVSTGLIVVAVLMTIDPHITYRGSADLLFALIALIGVRAATSDGVSAPARGD